MQRAKASSWELVDPPAFVEPDDKAGGVVVEPSCAT
jgi:hypothetical protein